MTSQSNIWNKYKIIQEVNSSSNIKTYLTFIQPIVKEIIPKDKEDYDILLEKIQDSREELNIYEIIKEKDKIYVALENNDELLSKLEKLILSEDSKIKKEGVIEGQGNPIKETEIMDLFKMKNSMCKIYYEDEKGNKGKGSGFFCQINLDFPIKYALFTNNHVLNELNLEIGNTIYFEYFSKSIFSNSCSLVKKQIKITENRKVFTNKELDYTCIELFKADGIVDFFKIEPKIFKYDLNNLNNNDIFILQFPNGNDLSFSNGKIVSINHNIIKHSASTESGSSGSPIIRRCKENYIVGLHFGFLKNKKYNLATTFDSIIDDINEQLKKINLIPNKNDGNKDSNNRDINKDSNSGDNNKDINNRDNNKDINNRDNNQNSSNEDNNKDINNIDNNQNSNNGDNNKDSGNEDNNKDSNNKDNNNENEKNDKNEAVKESGINNSKKELSSFNNLDLYPPKYNSNNQNNLNKNDNNDFNSFINYKSYDYNNQNNNLQTGKFPYYQNDYDNRNDDFKIGNFPNYQNNYNNEKYNFQTGKFSNYQNNYINQNNNFQTGKFPNYQNKYNNIYNYNNYNKNYNDNGFNNYSNNIYNGGGGIYCYNNYNNMINEKENNNFKLNNNNITENFTNKNNNNMIDEKEDNNFKINNNFKTESFTNKNNNMEINDKKVENTKEINNNILQNNAKMEINNIKMENNDDNIVEINNKNQNITNKKYDNPFGFMQKSLSSLIYNFSNKKNNNISNKN